MDDPLSSALRSLPRHRASAGFTSDVLRRLDDRHRPRARSRGPAGRGPAGRDSVRWPLLAAAAALALLVVGFGAREWWHLHQRQQATAHLATLEQERRLLAAELAELQAQVTGAQPVVYLGGSNDLDLVLDLEQVRRTGARPEDLPQGLLRAYRLSLSDRGSAARAAGGRAPGMDRRAAAGRAVERPAYAGPGPARAGMRPARLDERRTRTIY